MGVLAGYGSVLVSKKDLFGAQMKLKPELDPNLTRPKHGMDTVWVRYSYGMTRRGINVKIRRFTIAKCVLNQWLKIIKKPETTGAT